MKKIMNFFIWLFSLIFLMACSDDDAATSSPTSRDVFFDQAEVALSDGVGTFNVILKSSDLTLGLQLTSETTSGAILETGTYEVTRTKNVEYSILSDKTLSYWSEGTVASHTVIAGVVTVVYRDGKSSLSGTLRDKDGNTLLFRTGEILFSVSSATSVEFTQVLDKAYSLRSGNGAYGMVLANADKSKAVLLYLYNGPAENSEVPILPAGRYIGATSGISGGLFMNNVSYWLDTNTSTEHYLKSASCNVEYISGEAVLNGFLVDTEGQSLRFSFKGKLEFGRYRQIDMDFYHSMSGEWRMNAEEWWVYNSKTKEWGLADKPSSRTKCVTNWIGVPDYGKFFVTGLWDANASGMFVNASGTALSISAGYVANPLFIAMSSSDNYYIFPVLYDPEAGYFMTSGTIGLALSDDNKTLQVQGAKTTTKDSETGREVEVNYNYFGVLGRGLTTGRLQLFSNWSFAYLPAFELTAPATRSVESMQENSIQIMCARLQNEEPIESIKLTDFSTEEAIGIFSINQ